METNLVNGGSTFDKLKRRLEMLELWRELAIRPKRDECFDDLDLLERELDDCEELSRRSLKARQLMNGNLPAVEDERDQDLVPRPSGIPKAGLGLYFEPINQEPMLKGETICYYSGHIHNYHSAKSLKDRSYLMRIGDVLVDPGPLPEIKARYINDPLDEHYVNCKFVPGELRAAVVATRVIEPTEELYVSYGDGYWAQHDTLGRQKV
jgi:hypothetical protein